MRAQLAQRLDALWVVVDDRLVERRAAEVVHDIRRAAFRRKELQDLGIPLGGGLGWERFKRPWRGALTAGGQCWSGRGTKPRCLAQSQGRVSLTLASVPRVQRTTVTEKVAFHRSPSSVNRARVFAHQMQGGPAIVVRRYGGHVMAAQHLLDLRHKVVRRKIAELCREILLAPGVLLTQVVRQRVAEHDEVLERLHFARISLLEFTHKLAHAEHRLQIHRARLGHPSAARKPTCASGNARTRARIHAHARTRASARARARAHAHGRGRVHTRVPLLTNGVGGGGGGGGRRSPRRRSLRRRIPLRRRRLRRVDKQRRRLYRKAQLGGRRHGRGIGRRVRQPGAVVVFRQAVLFKPTLPFALRRLVRASGSVRLLRLA
eukprot:6184789-Pleurochrysis_carterae.AAC.1